MTITLDSTINTDMNTVIVADLAVGYAQRDKTAHKYALMMNLKAYTTGSS